MERHYEEMIFDDIRELGLEGEVAITFEGDMPYSRAITNLIRAYPITDSLVKRIYAGINWTAGREMSYMDPALDSQRIDNQPELLALPRELLLESRYYDIYRDTEDRLIVVCDFPNS